MKNKKMIIIICVIVIILCIVAGIIIFIKRPRSVAITENTETEEKIVIEEQNQEGKKIDIIDINSKSRPYAVVINNTAVAVKVQQGLNKAYLVYEIPTEGNTSRLLALYKDVQEEIVMGTIRSARHNFIDFALESDAIFCCFGWSHYAEAEMKEGIIDYFQGLFGGPFYRNNPESLASEHTAYTSMNKLKEAIKQKGIRTESASASTLLNYDAEDVDLSMIEGVKKADSVIIPYGKAPQIASFVYDENLKMYVRYENSNKCVEYDTKEEITAKNVIVQKIEYEKCDDNYYWDLKTIGSGKGYYITNGYAIPISWSKKDRESETKYCYETGTKINGKDVGGTEIKVSDGRTWIEIQTTSQKLTINQK